MNFKVSPEDAVKKLRNDHELPFTIVMRYGGEAI